MTPRRVLWLIIVITILAAFINVPSTMPFPQNARVFGQEINVAFFSPANLSQMFPIKLGLDLQGGTQLTLETKMDKINSTDRDTALEAARQVIERRVNLYGVSEAVVQSSTLGEQRRILVELPGVKDPQEAVNLVGRTAQLEFRESPATSSAQATPSAQASPSAEATSSALNDIFSYQPTGLTGADLKKASVTFGSSGTKTGPQVAIEFTEEGGKKFAEITKRNVGKPLAIFLDDVPLMWPPPTVQQEIIGGSGVITGSFTSQEAKNLSIQLNAGALPVPIEILEQRSIGATLGNQSVEKSLIAGAIGILAVMIFMVAYYGIYGLLADLALIIYTLLVLTVFRTGLFILPPVTLTLAGIAGFILSVGMAVDANILTFERIKDELRSGKSGRLALEDGFSRAWTSIRDSNISSLITASILIIFGTSVVRGFALTLAIGVMVSMFSAIVVTRTFLRLLPRFRR
ncbi:MAG: Preprotein translocase subunit SecD [Candidatus Daviesbacteria bacterium GW2011_GWA1_41_61]|uniref:Protein translocase subunit SecD n=1 Tax=Candidatus Daviesbacteria bacterium GW2011_GWA2_40_9 TaxID=1618424 RepID=A0A0G0X7F0_9BACT|nr:MAG: protein-export membrane protein, preprotein translocase subunit SecD [Candidatus Daviesbacteria bacterium GW2011_GWC1_40_9]KKR83562.1 MAG: Preprotein translocase subunit SecD [Candidatus Daviesbacteria bacterium GW2011_GWA2_40_9]KKR93131.1 MAG: Preprotein translocase subunit SecD [Candidatus Daviesbacteria bacterium GW2011_GWB1_41_15]KKS15675.1 MAG: Preprotein translocase subunit SecD [Candidatus Daviesbacteria bacterium GW2011_GWA1_41_61]